MTMYRIYSTSSLLSFVIVVVLLTLLLFIDADYTTMAFQLQSPIIIQSQQQQQQYQNQIYCISKSTIKGISCRHHHYHHFCSRLFGQQYPNEETDCDGNSLLHAERLTNTARRLLIGTTVGFTVLASAFFGNVPGTVVSSSFTTAHASDATTTTQKNYDGFAEYAKENKMEQSDVSCFIKECGPQTKELFRNPRGIKGIVCLGKCKGEQSCATRCFAQYNSDALNDWLSCTIEEHECVKVPKQTIDNSAENKGYSTAITNFDPNTLVGTWYKTNGLNPNYDLFDCQTNTFTKTNDNELDMGIFFRIQRPIESGGGFWENQLTEHMIVDTTTTTPTTTDSSSTDIIVQTDDSIGRTMHTSGKMYGLKFNENWFILGESDGKGDIPPFKLVAYKGHTLQGNYEGAFVYAKEPVLPTAAISAVRDAAQKAGLNFDDFTIIDNTCPTGNPLNDDNAGTGTTTTDWIDLITGEGGVIDWISPGWRGEYTK